MLGEGLLGHAERGPEALHALGRRHGANAPGSRARRVGRPAGAGLQRAGGSLPPRVRAMSTATHTPGPWRVAYNIHGQPIVGSASAGLVPIRTAFRENAFTPG